MNIPLLTDLWFSDPAQMRDWAATWQTPHMQAGLRLLTAMGLPKAPVIAPGVDAIHLAALRAASSGGYFDFARNIEALKHLRPEPAPAPAPTGSWGEADLDTPPEGPLAKTAPASRARKAR